MTLLGVKIFLSPLCVVAVTLAGRRWGLAMAGVFGGCPWSPGRSSSPRPSTGFDAGALRSESSISDRSSLAVEVGNAVACAWAQSWIAARAAGDQAAAEAALEALASSPSWPIVRTTKAPWFSNYEVVVKQMRAGRLDNSPSAYETTTDGRTYGYGPAWKEALGCKGTYRREVPAP